MAYPQFIDNSRKKLSNVLNEIAPKYKVLRIATGYWDLAGTLELINDFEQYNKIQLLIGKEPIAHRLQTQYNINMAAPENLFPDADIKHDLQEYGNSEELEQLRDTAKKLVKLMKSNTPCAFVDSVSLLRHHVSISSWNDSPGPQDAQNRSKEARIESDPLFHFPDASLYLTKRQKKSENSD